MNPYAGSDDNFPASVLLPDDSDPPMAATFNPAPQGLADRTMSLANGYQTELANTAALKAIDTTMLATGAIRRVAGLGRFVLDKTTYPLWNEDLPMVVAPTVGTGRWFAQDDEARHQYEFIASAVGVTAWMCPPNLALVQVELIGGGGGGGGGGGADVTTSDAPGGGGGGAGARVIAIVAPSPGQQHDATVGDGGPGGAAGASGSDGLATSLGVHGVGPFIAANGGQGGSAGTTALSDIGGMSTVVVPGGSMGAGATTKAPGYYAATLIPQRQRAGDGGQSTNSQAGNYADGARAGATNLGGQANLKTGGAAGARGANNTHLGGGGGGGGGAGYYGNGGAGGAGGTGDPGAANTDGSPGIAAGANSGAGGGGGGGAGAGTAGHVGGAGGKGGSGQIIIRGFA